MKYLLTFFTVFLTAQFLHAQSNFKPGYIVNNQNDTIKGLIDYQEHYNNPREFILKSPDQKTLTYSVGNAKTVGITGYDIYEKFIVTVTKGYNTIDKLTSQLDSSYVTDTVFLRTINKGKNVSLYAYTDNIKSRLYILDNQSKAITELKYFAYISDETRSVVDVNTYRRQLLFIADKYQQGNTKVTGYINDASYDERTLLKIVQQINGGTGEAMSISKNLAGIRFFAGVGVRSGTIKFSGNTETFDDGTTKSSVGPTIDLGVDYVLNKEIPRLVLRGELLWASTKYDIKNVPLLDNTFAGASDSYTGALNLTQQSVSIYPQFIYNFVSTKTIKVYADAGLAFNFSSYGNYNFIKTETLNGKTYTSTPNEPLVLQSTWISVPLKLGVFINNNFEVYAAYWLPGSITKYQNASVTISGYQGGINYLFGGK